MKYLIVNDMNDDYAKQICAWQYKGEYAVYNLPNFETAKQKNYSICNPQKSKEFFCFLNDKNQVIAYSRFVQKHNSFVMGVGVLPNLTGQGFGCEVIQKSIEKLKTLYPNANVELQVRAWNIRAIKCYQKCGFKILKTENIVDHTGQLFEFVFMEI